MKSFLKFVDKWGPGVLSIVTLLGVVAFGWVYGERVSRLQGAVDARLQMELALRTEIQTYQAHTVKLREILQESGLKLPPLPEPVVLLAPPEQSKSSSEPKSPEPKPSHKH